MRHLPQLGFLCIATLSACKPDCGGVQAFNNFTYRGFANPVIHESNNPAFTEGPEYWSYGSPANGASEWQFKWGGVAQGPRIFDHPQAHHVPEVYDGIGATEAAALA